MPDLFTKLASEVRDESEIPPAHIRFGLVTEIEPVAPFRVKTSITGGAWISRDKDTQFAVNDRVWMIQQGATFFACGHY